MLLRTFNVVADKQKVIEPLPYVGSNNLTVGGTETNLECGVRLDLVLPDDAGVHADLISCWDDAAKAGLRLDRNLLSQLSATGMVLDENQMQRGATLRGLAASASVPGRPAFPHIRVRPPSPIPPASMRQRTAAVKAKAKAKKKVASKLTAPAPAAPSLGTQALVIQVTPHHNGEVFLSKLAANQNPAFFGWPFTGQTVPKKPHNPSYPQRTPDPVIDLKVYGSSGKLIIRHNPFNLNTVYYEKKSEIRITVPPDVVKAVPEDSIMVMRQAADEQGQDYDVEIFVKGSTRYDEYLAVCNQKMPSGGRSEPRRFGWL